MIEGYNFYKKIQGTKYDKQDSGTRNKLKFFREELGSFTDEIFEKQDLISVPNGKGMWQNSGNFTKYMWNRYKMQDDKTNLVIYFNASTISDEGLFISIGLIDDKLNDFEKENANAIYQFLETECKNIDCPDFIRHNTGWGERVFSIINETNYENIDYECLLTKLKEVYINTISKFYSKNNKSLVTKENEESDMPNTTALNQILYGPPGTGKTYNTINKAIEIVDNEFYQLYKEETSENRKALKEKFEEYKKAGQIEFITFHQSYGYEEFVEGIKAETTESENIRYEVKAGIFKKLTKKATNNYNSSKKTTQQLIQEKTLQQKLNIFLNDCLDEQVEFSKTKGGKFKIQDLNEDEVILFTEDSNYNDKILRLQRDELFKILDADIKLNTSRQMAKDIFGINNQRQKDTYYLSIYKKFNETKFDNIEEISSDEPLKNHILIIDEINRGNISKIFGELITLIEPSKRIGEDEEIRVKLPYSGNDSEPFGVPSNLYIIGTMNTADRSIAQIDTALRRRFVFEEMMPKPELLQDITIEDTTINVEKILEAMNERIEYIYDREHTLGHSYFLPLLKTSTKEKLDEIFKVNIIPLLAEYFYGDWADIEFILNNNFIQEKKIKQYIKEDTRQFNRVYEVNGTFDTMGYIKIYNGARE